MKKYTFTLETQPQLCPIPCEKASVVFQITAGDQLSLFELAEAMLASIGFDSDHAFGFHESPGYVYDNKGRSYTLFADVGEDEHATGGVRGTVVSDVFSPGDTWLFHFDYGDDWHFFVTCDQIDPSDAKREAFKRVSVIGSLPSQYGDE